MTLRNDYSGAFDPELKLTDFSRDFLSRLTHEFNLIGHLLDRVGQPLVALEYGEEGFVRSGIEEWQCASPIYSKRMQKLMNFEGNDVGTVFKNIQLEVGAPQQFLDFQFRLDSPEYGEFWLPFCGALNDLEKNGNDPNLTRAMCHDIEDPTFDATAAATNPYMVMRPIHRPPRINGDGGNGEGRYPVCRWQVFISDEAQPYANHPNLEVMRNTRLAGIELVQPEQWSDEGGWDDYSGPLDTLCQFEDFSQRALTLLAQENAVQALLLAHSYTLSLATHYGDDVARRFSERTWVGHAALAVERLQKNLDLGGNDIETMAKILQLHPHFHPRTYADIGIRITGANSLRISLRDCPALHETIAHTWFTQLSPEPHPAFDSLVAQVNPRARCHTVADPGDAAFAWDVIIDPANEEAAVPMELAIARTSSGVNFKLERRRLPVGVIARSQT
ncbi:MAG: hypothetical protein KDI09_06705 [Halioglobus sp.]|nr:hypothetical protein [Halioglobus sp.]